jgi:hypothetical protein
MPVVTTLYEIEFVPGSGTYVDVTAYVARHKINRPKYTASGGASTTTLEMEMYNSPVNGVCPWSPDSPLAPNYPNLTRDRRIRVTAVWNAGASTSIRFLGWTDQWVPDAGDAPPETAMVTVLASCVLSRYARRRLLSPFGERAVSIGANALYYPFDEAENADTVRVVTQTTAGTHAGEVVQPRGYPGSATFTSPDGGHLTDGQIDFTRGDNNTPAPVVLINLRDDSTTTPPKYISGWFKLAADPKGSTGDVILAAYGRTGGLLWLFTVLVSGGNVTWAMVDQNGTSNSFFDTGAPRDEGWHYWALSLGNGTTTQMNTRTKGDTGQQAFGSFAWPYDPRPVQYLVVGGRMNPFIRGKQLDTFLGSVSSLSIQYDGNFDLAQYGNPGIISTADAVRTTILVSSTTIDTLVGGGVSNTPDDTPVVYTTSTANVLERYNELARTVGGAVVTRPSGRRGYLRGVDMYPAVPSVVLDAEQDLSAPDGGWQATKDERPTRVTVTAPIGSVEVVDTVTEAATSLRLEGSGFDTAAGSLDVARSVAGLILNDGGSRLAGWGVDVTTTSTDKITAMMNLVPLARARISGLPGALMGVTWVDVYVNGWTEVGDQEDGSYRFQFSDSSYADDPPAGRFDDTDYGRFALTGATVTGGTAPGTTAAGTIVITSASGVLDTTAGYPLELDWNGERVSVSGVGGGTSPQTATISSRGNAPSVARVHSAGEPVQLHFPLTFGA